MPTLQLNITEQEWNCGYMTTEEITDHLGCSNSYARYIKKVYDKGTPVKNKVYSGEIVGAFGCAHIPFDHPRYLSFLADTFQAEGVTQVVCLGDVVDNHAISFHTRSPNGFSAGSELIRARARLKDYAGIFPNVEIVLGNHDLLPWRQAEANGLPEEMIRNPQEIWETPDTWTWQEEVEIDGVRYVHGTAMGKAALLARKGGQSVVMAHWHSEGYVQYAASWRTITFGVAVGCGIDHKAYAMAYGKPFKEKPILGCAIIRGGVDATFIPMPLEVYKR